MQVNFPDPPLGAGSLLFGNPVTNDEFQSVVTQGLFEAIVPNPKNLEGPAAKYHADLAPVANLRARVQRLVNGAKRKNVDPYAEYIIRNVDLGDGFTPQIVLWTEKQLRVEIDPNTGLAWALVPHGMKFVALDGDTQTAARYLADLKKAGGLPDDLKIKVAIKHGVSEERAQQIFADCNSKGVKVSTSMAIGLDNRDDATQLAKQVEIDVAPLTGKVNRQKRQLGGQDTDLITMSALRASVVCFVLGIGGVQFQTKTVEIEAGKVEQYKAAAAMWYRLAIDALGSTLMPENRASTFSAAPAVWSAIGAIGHDVLVNLCGEDVQGDVGIEVLSDAFAHAAASMIAPVDWKRADHWLAVGAKKSSSGAVTLGGPKEAGSLVYKGLKEGVLSGGIVTTAAA